MQKLKLTLLVISILILSAFTYQTQEFQHLITRKLTLQGGGAVFNSTLDMTADVIQNVGNSGTDFDTNGGLTTAAGVTISSGGLTLSDGNAVVADFTRVLTQTAISVTDHAIITPTGSFQLLESANVSPVSATLSTGCSVGQQVILVNTVTQNIIISDTTPAVLSGAATLGQYDALRVLCDGTRWIQVAPESDN